jgi:hypothetical protein
MGVLFLYGAERGGGNMGQGGGGVTNGDWRTRRAGNKTPHKSL